MGDTFNISINKLGDSISELTRYKGLLENHSEEFEGILNDIKANWTSDVGNDLADLTEALKACIACLDGLVIPVLGDIIAIMTSLKEGTEKISSASI